MLSDEESEEDGVAIPNRLFGVLVLGITLIFVGIAVVVLSLVLSGFGSVGGVIFIGPLPIVFGAGPNSTWLIIISLVIAVLSIILFIVINRRTRRKSD